MIIEQPIANSQQPNYKQMNYIFIFSMLFLTNIGFAQSAFPDFLHGTWKMEN